MSYKFYDFGNKERFVPEEADRNFTDMSLAIQTAKEKKLGFIVQHEDFGDRVETTIMAWNAQVLSFREVYRRFAHIPAVYEMLQTSSPVRDVFVVDNLTKRVIKLKRDKFRLIPLLGI